MKWNKEELRGTKKVFAFSFVQLLKNKGNLISLILMVVIASAVIPYYAITNSGSAGTEIESSYEQLGITAEQYELINSTITTSSGTLEEYLESENGALNDWDTSYWLQFGYTMIVMIMSIIAISYIVRAIVEEKASKLVELLMVSVKPLALISGKILAVMCYIFTMLLLMIAGMIASYFITDMFVDVSSLIQTNMLTSILKSIDVVSVVSVVISLLTGFLTFSLIAGLSGSGCSSTTDTEAATMVPTMVIMAGYLVGAAVGGANNTAVSTVCSLLPIVSVFCAPVQYLLGNISFAVLAAAWVIQLLTVVFLAGFCASVYKELIIYKGSRIKISAMVRMAFSGKRRNEVK